MDDKEVLDKIIENIYYLGWSMQDAPFRGVSSDTVKGVNFAINKILKDTGISYEDVVNKK